MMRTTSRFSRPKRADRVPARVMRVVFGAVFIFVAYMALLSYHATSGLF